MFSRRYLSKKCTQVQLHKGKIILILLQPFYAPKTKLEMPYSLLQCPHQCWKGAQRTCLFFRRFWAFRSWYFQVCNTWIFFCRSCIRSLPCTISQCSMSKENFNLFQFTGTCYCSHCLINYPLQDMQLILNGFNFFSGGMMHLIYYKPTEYRFSMNVLMFATSVFTLSFIAVLYFLDFLF